MSLSLYFYPNSRIYLHRGQESVRLVTHEFPWLPTKTPHGYLSRIIYIHRHLEGQIMMFCHIDGKGKLRAAWRYIFHKMNVIIPKPLNRERLSIEIHSRYIKSSPAFRVHTFPICPDGWQESVLGSKSCVISPSTQRAYIRESLAREWASALVSFLRY